MDKFSTIIFDLDGTLLNTLEDLRDSLNRTLEKYGRPQHTLDEVRFYVGNGIKKMAERALEKGLEDEQFDSILADLTADYSKNSAVKTAPYPGVCELLRKLKESGKKIAVVSNKPDPAVKKLVPFYFGDVMDAAIGESPSVAPKPAPDSVFEALRLLGAGTEGAVYIGDSEVDYNTAVNAGLPCISVAWGFRTEEFLRDLGAEQIVLSVDELESVLL